MTRERRTLPAGARGRSTPVLSDSGNQAKFSYTGQPVNWVVPAGVTSVTYEAAGGSGGGDLGSAGADLMGTVTVTPGETFVIAVGGNGTTSSPGGWGYDGTSGGPANSASPSDRSGGAGGGATFIGIQNGTTIEPLVIAGGGGGGGGGSGDPISAGIGGSSGCLAWTTKGSPTDPDGYPCTTPSLSGPNGSHGTVGPLGGSGGATGGASTSTGQRGLGAQNLGGNGGSGGGGLLGGAAGGGAKGLSAGGGGGGGTSWYDTTAVSNPIVTNRYRAYGTPAQLAIAPSGSSSGQGVILTY